MNGATTPRERYETAALLLWILAAFNVFGGVMLMVRAPDGAAGMVGALGIATVVTALLFGALGFFVRRGSQAAVVAAVIVLGLVLAIRAVPLFTGDLRLTHFLSVAVTAAVLLIVGRALRT